MVWYCRACQTAWLQHWSAAVPAQTCCNCGVVGPVPAPVRTIAVAISSRSTAVNSRLAAAIQPFTCWGERAPTMAPVTPGQAITHASATADTVVLWRCAIGRRASLKAKLRLRLGSWKSGERRLQSSWENFATLSAVKPSVSSPDCMGL
jgi:hypothetical protein